MCWPYLLPLGEGLCHKESARVTCTPQSAHLEGAQPASQHTQPHRKPAKPNNKFGFQSHKPGTAQGPAAISTHQKDIIEMTTSNYDIKIKYVLMKANLLEVQLQGTSLTEANSGGVHLQHHPLPPFPPVSSSSLPSDTSNGDSCNE